MRPISILAALMAAGFAFTPGAPVSAAGQTQPTESNSSLAVGPQYDSTHVYVAPEDLDRFVASFVGTFGGTGSKAAVTTVTPTPSETVLRFILSPVGTLSIFGFKTPIPYPFGGERTGYLVVDLDAAVRAAEADGADVIVAPFPDPIGRDVVIQWPGGVNMQLYWHTTAPSYDALLTVPENRVYVSPERADTFIHDFVAFSHGKIAADDGKASGADIGLPDGTFRRVRIESAFGKVTVMVTDGH